MFAFNSRVGRKPLASKKTAVCVGELGRQIDDLVHSWLAVSLSDFDHVEIGYDLVPAITCDLTPVGIDKPSHRLMTWPCPIVSGACWGACLNQSQITWPHMRIMRALIQEVLGFLLMV